MVTSTMVSMESLSPKIIGFLIICSSLVIALFVCTGVCLAMWYRKLRGRPTKDTPVNLIIHRQSANKSGPPSNMTLLLPTITQSEVGSEPCTPASTITPTGSGIWGNRSRRCTPGSQTSAPIFEDLSQLAWKFPQVHSKELDVHPYTHRLSSTGPSTHPPSVFPTALNERRLYRNSSALISIASNESSIDSFPWTGSLASSCGLGEIKIRVIYQVKTRQLRIMVISAHHLPARFHNSKTQLYTKLIIVSGLDRVRYTSPLVAATPSPTFCTTFRHPSSLAKLVQASVTLSVCQEEDGGRRVVAGSAAVHLKKLGLTEDLEHDVDSGHLILPLQDSAPDQKVRCGGELRLGLAWNGVQKCLDISNIIISNVNLQLLLPEEPVTEKDLPWVYVKVSVFLEGALLCWRRTRPVPLYPDLTLLEDDLQLHIPTRHLHHVTLSLTLRQKTHQRGGRRVLGGITVGNRSDTESGKDHWTATLQSAPSPAVMTHILSH